SDRTGRPGDGLIKRPRVSRSPGPNRRRSPLGKDHRADATPAHVTSHSPEGRDCSSADEAPAAAIPRRPDRSSAAEAPAAAHFPRGDPIASAADVLAASFRALARILPYEGTHARTQPTVGLAHLGRAV